MAKKKQEDALGADLNLGFGAGGPVRVHRLADGRALLLPGSRRPASGDALECLADIQDQVREIARRRQVLDELVDEARKNHGLPWSLLGFCVGTTAEAARQRWSA